MKSSLSAIEAGWIGIAGSTGLIYHSEMGDLPSKVRQLMVDSLSIRNFRSFKEAEVRKCARINVIVGDNGCGKTSLLEGLFLASGASPELAVRTRGWRGLEAQQMSGDHNDIWNALFSDLFHGFDASKSASISMKGQNSENRSISIQMAKARIVAPRRNMPGEPPRVIPFRAPIQFVYKVRNEPDDIVEPYFDQGNIQFTPAIHNDPLKVSFYASNRTPPHQESAKRFSELSQNFKQVAFQEQFSRIYPTISDISVELSGGAPALFAAVKGLSRKIPLTLASGGMNKLVAIMLAMSAQQGGLVLIDELENGFYYSHMPVIWESILSFSREFNCQVFASTHSYECLSVAAELAKEFPSEFSIIRAMKKDGETQLHSYGGAKFADAIEENIEIR